MQIKKLYAKKITERKTLIFKLLFIHFSIAKTCLVRKIKKNKNLEKAFKLENANFI